MAKKNVALVGKIIAIVEAARSQRFTDEIEEIEMLSYTEEDKRGNVKKLENRFDYIDTTTIPVTIRFIGGTGFENVSCSINHLTKESVGLLYNCVG